MPRASRLAVTALAAALTACAHPTTTPPANPATTQPPATPRTAPVAASPTFHPPVDTTDPTCTPDQLTVSRGYGEGATGHGAEQVLFRNHGRTCQLTGYPTIEMLDQAGHIVERATPTQADFLGGYGGPAGEPLPQVRLVNGATASALTQGINGPFIGDPRPCPSYVAYRITPPGTPPGRHTSVRMDSRASLCYPTVQPIVPGTDHYYPPEK